MAISIDLPGLLALLADEDEFELLFALEPRRGTAVVDLLPPMREAMAEADAAALARNPDDPTSATEPDPSPKGVVAEINEGSFTEDEVTSWLTDLAAGLEKRGVSGRLVPFRHDDRVPPIELWRMEFPLTPTLVMTFTPTTEGHYPEVPEATLREVLPLVAAWTRLPAATAVLSPGLHSFVVPSDGLSAAALDVIPLSPQQLSLLQCTAEPRRVRYFGVQLEAFGSLQALDASTSPIQKVQDLIEIIPSLAPYLSNAGIRCTTPVYGTIMNGALDHSGQDYTAAQEVIQRGLGLDLLDSLVMDAYGVQLLTDAHLAGFDLPDDFDATDLGNGRHLVVAKDLEAWFAEPLPDRETQESARAAFAPIILSMEAVARRASSDD